MNAEQRKQFRSRMWEFRRRPEDLDAKQRAALEELFVRLPALRVVYELRWDLTHIFDTAADRLVLLRHVNDAHAPFTNLL